MEKKEEEEKLTNREDERGEHFTEYTIIKISN